MLKLGPICGNIRIFKVDDARDLWFIIDELKTDEKDDTGFWHNRVEITEHYKNGTLFSLRMQETHEIFKDGIRANEIFARGSYGDLSFYLLPCFVAMVGDKVDMIWVHSRARKLGIGSELVKQSRATGTLAKLPESIGFWERIFL